MKINGVSACWSGLSYYDSVHKLVNGTIEPLIGELTTEHLQLCPQHRDLLTSDVINKLLIDFPNTQFRLHSDVRVPKKSGYTLDLIDLDNSSKWYFEHLNILSEQLHAPLYSLHAGKRGNRSMQELFDNYYTLTELFHCPVAVEGHYPYKNSYWLVSNWKEYESLLLNGINYAIDLSHLNIVAHREGWDWELTKALIMSEQCKEIHISFNEGIVDNHIVSHDTYYPLWEKWQDLIKLAPKTCTLFSEGNQVLEIRRKEKLEIFYEK